MKTTLNKIRQHAPCSDGWKKLLKSLGKRESDDEPLSILTILESNGLDDALWALRAVEGHDREIRLYAVWCARQVQHLMTDPRSVAAIDAAEAYANGTITTTQLVTARAAASAAARAAAASAGAWAAARDVVSAAASDAAWDAAMAAAAWAAAASAVAWDAARAAAARDAAWDAARAAQEVELRRICGGKA